MEESGAAEAVGCAAGGVAGAAGSEGTLIVSLVRHAETAFSSSMLSAVLNRI
jgi:hypothetical protein